MAKKKGALVSIQEQFRNGKVKKIYLARTQRKPEKDQGTLRHWAGEGPESENRQRAFPSGGSRSGSAALYQVDAFKEGGWLWRIELLSGRFHQIRAQLSAIGCPVIGDTLYGGLSLPGSPGIALHALELHFHDPLTGEPITVRAPQPETLAWLLA